MTNSFKIYIRPADLLQVNVTDDLTLDFSAPWMKGYNAILVDRYPRGEKFEVWPRTINAETGKDLGSGSYGFMQIPAHLYDRLTEALKASGFTEFVPHAGKS